MPKEVGNIRVLETEEGFQIEVKGKDLKGALSKCCPLVVCCCQPTQEKKKE